jgi:DNA-binding beta-propeller fold protein YncE
MAALLVAWLATGLYAAEYRAPAGPRPAMRRPGASSILPGGRIVAPLGSQHATGPGPFGLAVSPNGRIVVTVDGGPGRSSLTVLERERNGWVSQRITAARKQDEGDEGDEKDQFHSVFMGVAFQGDGSVWVSEGNSGRVRLLRVSNGSRQQLIDLNQGGFQDSYTGDLAFDRERNLLFVLDQANFRLAVVDTRRRVVVANLRVGRLPFAISLAPDARRVYITNLGMFEYHAIPGANVNDAGRTGLSFPAFGFPSPEALDGIERTTAGGAVKVPGLGDPNTPQSNSLCVVNVADPAAPRIDAFIPTGLQFGKGSLGGSSPSGVLAVGNRVYVSNSHNDSITVINTTTLKPELETPIRVPGLEHLRGVLPIGMAYHPGTEWLLVAEAGLNAVGVVDTRKHQVIAHLPVGWFPTRVVVDRDNVYVTNAKGHGSGANADRQGAHDRAFQADLRRGTVTVFPIPDSAEFPKHSGLVLAANGMLPQKESPGALPPGIRYVVLIVKENRTYDEVLGDIVTASNGNVAGAPMLARFGRYAMVYSDRMVEHPRLSLRNMNVTPNHHEMAFRWAFSDNFYADSEVSVDGHHWLAGSYPNAWTESTLTASHGGQRDLRFPAAAPGRLLFAGSSSSVSPEEQLEAGTLWHHLERHGISFRNFGEGFELAGVNGEPGLKPTGGRFLTNIPMPEPLYRNTSRNYPQYNMNIPDQYRASQFIQEMNALYGKGGQAFPHFIFIHLPNDHLAKPRPDDGYPFQASFMADNDYALGRIMEYLTRLRQWKEMAVFVTEDDAQGGVDHIDSHRTVLLVASPYAKKNYVSHVNSSFPGLLKTVFRLLKIPPLNLFDAVASDLSDCFTDTPDFAPFELKKSDARLFEPDQARDPLDPEALPRIDDPRVLREQNRR